MERRKEQELHYCHLSKFQIIYILVVILIFLVLSFFGRYEECSETLSPPPVFSNETGDYYIGESSFTITTICTRKFNYPFK